MPSSRPIVLAATAVAALLAPVAGAAAADGVHKGPSTTKNPYVLPVAGGVETTSLLTVGDKPASNGYRMVGIPDGLGAFRAGRNFEVSMNHELGPTAGAVRRHGQKGAFVSNMTIDRRTLEVRAGRDLINPGVRFWDYATQTYTPTASSGGLNPRNPTDTFVAQVPAFARFCSGTLAALGQLYSRSTSRGYAGRIYFGNEESGNEGRTFGITEDGDTQQLPRLGQFSWENTIPAANRSARTLVQGQEDNAEGQIWSYVGTKRRTGSAFDRAGLTNGSLNVVDAVDETVSTDAEFRAKYGKGVPAEVDLSSVDWDQSGAAANREAKADGLTLNRIEDGHWDPSNRNDFYFLTTEGGNTTSAPGGTVPRDGGGLWRLSYEDIEHPELGATLTLLLDGSEAPYLSKPDNMTIDEDGNLLIQEDPGGNAHVARIVAYDIDTGRRGVLAQFDPALFAPATPGGSDAVLTTDEESSGIIDASDFLDDGTFLFDAQVHKSNPDPELVEEGQLLLLEVGSFRRVYDVG
jgi:sugar lactone lactonase YvrE